MRRLELTETERETLETMNHLSRGSNRIPAIRLQESDENQLLYAFLLPTNERTNHGKSSRPGREPSKGSD